MLRNKVNKGLGLAGLSLVAALMMSGAAFAQDAGEDPAVSPEGEGEVVIDDGGVVIDDGIYVIDPICIECSGEIIEDGEIWIDDGWVEDGEVADGEVDAGSDAGTGDEEILIYIDPAVTYCIEGDECTDPPELLDGDPDLNPEILYMSGGPAPAMEERGNDAGRVARSPSRAQRGEDLCVTPARELVWLCDLVNGKSE